jgi:hypothetical protein
MESGRPAERAVGDDRNPLLRGERQEPRPRLAIEKIVCKRNEIGAARRVIIGWSGIGE